MGMGDEIIATGDARVLQKEYMNQHPGEPVPKVMIVDIHDRPRWHVLWTDNKRLVHPKDAKGGKILKLKHGARCRPYVDYERMQREWPFKQRPYNIRLAHQLTPWRFTDAKVNRGEIYYLTKLDRRRNRIIIEPHCKRITPNRHWPWERYQAVVDAMPEIEWLQINRKGERLLRNVKHIPAITQLRAVELMQTAAAYFGPEGGLYHAAAAVETPAVALFGGYVSPANQGYDGPFYFNIYREMGGESPCGQRVACEHCRAAMDQIYPEEVIQNLTWIMNLGK